MLDVPRFPAASMRTLSPEEFQLLIRQPGVTLLDVRYAEELEAASLPGALNIPLPELPQRLTELDRAQPLAILCHHGVRSEHAARFLEREGFASVCHLAGGIDAWSRQLDPAVPRY